MVFFFLIIIIIIDKGFLEELNGTLHIQSINNTKLKVRNITKQINKPKNKAMSTEIYFKTKQIIIYLSDTS